jgi:hypothetical protein
MNLHEQLGALEAGVDQLIQAVVAPQAQTIPATPAASAAPEAAATAVAPPTEAVPAAASEDAASQDAAEAQAAVEAPSEDAPDEKPTLSVGRPAQNVITMTIGGKTVALHPEQVGQLIEELSNARATMKPEPAMVVPPGWRFVSTKNPALAVQKHPNGDRLLVIRHTGHGWVPFTFSPDKAIELYALLTQR